MTTAVETKQPAHSKVGASSYYRWKNCAGSVRLCSTVPNVSSEYAKEGTLAHSVADHYLAHGEFPRGTSVEMITAVMVYINSIFEDERKAADPGYVRFSEVRLDLSSIHPAAFGTADSVEIFPAAKHMIVRDYKHGAGVAVEAMESGEPNGQLSYYGLGALLKFEQYQIETVELVVVQPRCFHEDGPIRRVAVKAFDLLNFFADDLANFAIETEKPNAPLNAGKWCGFCSAKGVCPKLHENAVAAAKEDFAVAPLQQYSPEKLAVALSLIPQLEAFIKGVHEFAFAEALKGRAPTGHKLVAKAARRKWVEGVNPDVAAFELGIPVAELIEQPKLKSPAQLEKALDALDPDALKSLVVKESTGLVLVPLTDKRPAVRNDPSSDFSVIETSSTSLD